VACHALFKSFSFQKIRFEKKLKQRGYFPNVFGSKLRLSILISNNCNIPSNKANAVNCLLDANILKKLGLNYWQFFAGL